MFQGQIPHCTLPCSPASPPAIQASRKGSGIMQKSPAGASLTNGCYGLFRSPGVMTNLHMSSPIAKQRVSATVTFCP